jgi:cytochrome c oxidase assembly protein subunit 15
VNAMVTQTALGLTQYYLGVPVPLVALHLLGASLSVAAATNVLLAVRRRATTRPAPVADEAGADVRATVAAAR